MSASNLDLNSLPEESTAGRRAEGYDYVGKLYKDELLVSPIAVRYVPITLPPKLHFSKPEYASLYPLANLPSFELLPYNPIGNYQYPVPDQRHEWRKFVTFLYQRDKVVLIPVDGWQLIIKPPSGPPDEKTTLRVCYRRLTNRTFHEPMSPIGRPVEYGREPLRPRGEVLDPPGRGYEIPRQNAFTGVVPLTPAPLLNPRIGLMHPSYLQTLAQTHASWLFGGLAELVDNARDAGASKLSISISMVKMKGKPDVIPMLCFDDNGVGMTHTEIVRMLSFGHSAPTGGNLDKIGHFGVGFKTGSMRLGKDVVVFTQSQSSRSIGLLSSSHNADKEVLEVPIVTYRKIHGIMELDLSVHTEAEGQACLAAVKKHSPFSEFEIGSMFERIEQVNKSGTLIYIYNLDTWGSGSECSLEWETENTKDPKDIFIRSRRARSRTGQTSKKIPLDYSLRSYLEVLFTNPRMTIRIQGSKVKTKRLAASLNTTQIVKGKVLGIQVELTLGRDSKEEKLYNCGIFLYWHGRLIEAYKRVGGMIHSAGMGIGVIGVIDVTTLMDNLDGRLGVLNTKQGFEDSEAYVDLERWLGEVFNKYWYHHFDNLEVVKAVEDGSQFEPDRQWVQCESCQKWRKLPNGVRSQDLPEDWYCYLPPFSKTCDEEEEKTEESIVTVAVHRTSLPMTSSPKSTVMLTPKDKNLEDGVEARQPVKKQATRKNVQFAGVSSGKGDAKRAGSESPPKRRLRRRG